MNRSGDDDAPRDCRGAPYSDQDIVFFLQGYHDCDLAEWCVSNLRKHFPQSPVVLVSDGDANPRWGRLAETYSGITVFYGERLFLLANGGALLQRMLDLFFKAPSRYLISMDPDTGIHRRFEYLPTSPGLFGTLQTLPLNGPSGTVDYQHSIQGGFIGMTLSAARRLYETRCFLWPDLMDHERTWGRGEVTKERIVTEGLVSKDWILGYCAKRLRLPMYDFPEVHCRWKTYVPNPGLEYAVTHPCKERKL